MNKSFKVTLTALVLILSALPTQADFVSDLKKLGKQMVRGLKEVGVEFGSELKAFAKAAEQGFRAVRNELLKQAKEVTIDDDESTRFEGQDRETVIALRIERAMKIILGHPSCTIQQIKNALDAAKLIHESARDNATHFADKTGDWKIIPTVDGLPEGLWPYFWELENEAPSLKLKGDGGLIARVFKNEPKKRVVLVIYGTEMDFDNKLDLVNEHLDTNIRQGLGEHSRSHAMAGQWLGFLKDYYIQKGYSVECIGHSKGGGECLYAAAFNSLPATIFNSAGLRKTMRAPVEAKLGDSLEGALGNITHIHVAYEALLLANAIGFGRVWPEVAACSIDPYSPDLDFMERHSMETLYKSLDAFGEQERIQRAKQDEL